MPISRAPSGSEAAARSTLPWMVWPKNQRRHGDQHRCSKVPAPQIDWPEMSIAPTVEAGIRQRRRARALRTEEAISPMPSQHEMQRHRQDQQQQHRAASPTGWKAKRQISEPIGATIASDSSIDHAEPRLRAGGGIAGQRHDGGVDEVPRDDGQDARRAAAPSDISDRQAPRPARPAATACPAGARSAAWPASGCRTPAKSPCGTKITRVTENTISRPTASSTIDEAGGDARPATAARKIVEGPSCRAHAARGSVEQHPVCAVLHLHQHGGARMSMAVMDL